MPDAATTSGPHLAPLVRVVETFLAGASGQPELRLQMYPMRDVAPPREGQGRDWWGALTDQTDPVDGTLWYELPHGQIVVDSLLRVAGASYAPLPMPQQLALAALFLAFLSWEREVPDGCSDGGPALVFAPDGSGSVFYDGAHMAQWTAFDQGIAAIQALPR